MLHESGVVVGQALAEDSQRLSGTEAFILWLLAVGALFTGVCTLTVLRIAAVLALPFVYSAYLFLFAILSMGVVSVFRLARFGGYKFVAWWLFGLNALIIFDWFVELLVGLIKVWALT